VRLVVSHCGLGSAQEALYFHKPLLCIPFLFDQNDVAARIEDAHAGIRLDKVMLNAGDVRAAVEDLLGWSSVIGGGGRGGSSGGSGGNGTSTSYVIPSADDDDDEFNEDLICRDGAVCVPPTSPAVKTKAKTKPHTPAQPSPSLLDRSSNALVHKRGPYDRGARRMGLLLKRAGGVKRAADIIVATVENGCEHLYPAPLPWHKAAMLDVAVVFAAICCILVMCIRFAVAGGKEATQFQSEGGGSGGRGCGLCGASAGRALAGAEGKRVRGLSRCS
jgi:hypothetical protein